MTSFTNRLLVGVVLVLLAIAALGYFFRQHLILEFIGFVASQQNDIGPNRAVTWSRASPDSIRPKQTKPNIVLIVADDLGWNDISLHGGVANGAVQTPSIDSIAAEGVQFTNGYAAHATCAPSRAALMSGRYPTRFGFESTPGKGDGFKIISYLQEARDGQPKTITHFREKAAQDLPYEQKGMPSDEISLAELLRDAGYHTAHIGKWHLGLENGMAPQDQGFDESLLLQSGLYLPESDPNVVNARQGFDALDRVGWKMNAYSVSFNGSDSFEPATYITDYFTDEAIKVIEANKERPFFLYLAHWAPHAPLQATKSDYAALAHIENHRLRVYGAMIRALDRGVGRVLEALRANGIDDNTLVIFTSDNGGADYVGLPDINRPYRGWKMTYFEGGIHVPFFMRWPARIQAGTRFESPVHQFDIFATAAGAAESSLPTDRRIDGVDLLNYLPNPGEEVLRANAIPPHNQLFWIAGNNHTVIADGWKFQRDLTSNQSWLFDLANDPTEQRNLAKENLERVSTMANMLDQHSAEQAEAAWPILMEWPRRIDKTLDAPIEPDDEWVYFSN